MGEPGLIAAYLTELRYSLGKLADIEDVIAEVDDHLLTAVAHLVSGGMSRADAEAQAVARFGSPTLVARIYAEEAKRGAAVSTRLTRWAGMAAMTAPPLMIGGITVANLSASTQPGSGIGVAASLTAAAAFVFALVGLRRRHGGLGVLGRLAFWLAVVSFPAAMPFGYAGFIVLGVELGLVVLLLGIGLLRAGILPWPAVVLFAFSWPLWGPVAWVITALSDDANKYAELPIVATILGFMWLGRTMWREPALDVRPSQQNEPMALA